jgi:hypothetical protein
VQKPFYGLFSRHLLFIERNDVLDAFLGVCKSGAQI